MHLEFTFAMETQVAKIDPTYKKARLHPLRLILAIPNNSRSLLHIFYQHLDRVQTLKPNSKKRKLLRFFIQLQIQRFFYLSLFLFPLAIRKRSSLFMLCWLLQKICISKFIINIADFGLAREVNLSSHL